MPELPEVETICKSLSNLVLNIHISAVKINRPNLRYSIPQALKIHLPDNVFTKISRRGKYILLSTTQGTIIIHLGMSGRLLVLPQHQPAHKHEHVVINFANGLSMRLIDPRRFGAILWTDENPADHPLLEKLGVEPLSRDFTASSLHKAMANRRITIKQLLMDASVVVGVGNIYANEALFLSGIKPQRQAATLTKEDCQKLVAAIKKILRQAIKCGGTTIRDFVSSNGDLGYFAQQLRVYGRAQQLCMKCSSKLKATRLGQRSTFYCPTCQK